MAKLIILAVILAVLSFSNCFSIKQRSGAINWPFQVCGQGPWTVKALTLSATPSRNINDEIICTGIANDHIEFDHVDVQVKLNGLFLHGETVKYTDVYDQGDNVTFKYNNFIPSFAPAGTYLLTFNLKDSANGALGCFSFNFKL